MKDETKSRMKQNLRKWGEMQTRMILTLRRENCQWFQSGAKFSSARVNKWGLRTWILIYWNTGEKYRKNLSNDHANTWQIPLLQIGVLFLPLSVTSFFCLWSQKGGENMWWSTHNFLSEKREKIIIKQKKIRLYQLIYSLISIEELLSTTPLNTTPFN